MAAASNPHDELLDEMTGKFVVVTEDGATHHLDLDQRLITSSNSGPVTGIRVDPPPARLLTLATCRVGAPMVILIDRRARGVWFTRRTTATVTRIDTSSNVARLPQRVSR